jgi:Ala-tRNA(Pro) deacylase
MSIAASVQNFLDQERVDYEVILHPTTWDSVHTAQSADVPYERLAKCVVLEDENGYLMAVIPASHRLDVQAVGRELSRDLTLAGEMELMDLFIDCELGAVPPLGQAYGIDMVVDQKLADAPDVYFEGGDHVSLIHVSGTDFRELISDSPQGHISQQDGGRSRYLRAFASQPPQL